MQDQVYSDSLRTFPYIVVLCVVYIVSGFLRFLTSCNLCLVNITAPVSKQKLYEDCSVGFVVIVPSTYPICVNP